MKLFEKIILLLLIEIFLFSACRLNDSKSNQSNENIQREDAAYQVNINQEGSLQNPVWSPDGNFLLFTRFRNGYNQEPADLFVFELENETIKKLVSDESGNINLPGSAWNPSTHLIVFSSSREPHDEIFMIHGNGNPGDEIRITNRKDSAAYEPSFSPDGQWVVFESHELDVEENGIITKYKIDGTDSYQMLTARHEDCRQPNWSPTGETILYQKKSDGYWNIWIMDTDGKNHQKVTAGIGDKTDGSFSPDGLWIVYSSDEDDVDYANLFMIPVTGGNSTQLSFYGGYDGAPSWSPEGNRIAFESFASDPDESQGTKIWIIDVSN